MQLYSMQFRNCLPEKEEKDKEKKGTGKAQIIVEPESAGRGKTRTFYKDLAGLEKAIEGFDGERWIIPEI